MTFLLKETMMEELFELRNHIEKGRYAEALALIGEMEEMSRDDKINKIESFLQILLLHLIKQHAEQRTTRSWEVSIDNAADGVRRVNKRRKAGGYYLSKDELKESIEEIYPASLRQASLETFAGRYSANELAAKIDGEQIKARALEIVIKTP
jgi:hypothetical protein